MALPIGALFGTKITAGIPLWAAWHAQLLAALPVEEHEITLDKGLNDEIENIKNFLQTHGRIKYLKPLYYGWIKLNLKDQIVIKLLVRLYNTDIILYRILKTLFMKNY